MNHELNAQVAEEVMGLKDVSCHPGDHAPLDTSATIYVGGSRFHGPDSDRQLVPDFSGSLDAAWLMEEEIERRGLQTQYVGELWALLELDTIPYGTTYWPMAHATPEQRCRAALEAVRERTE